MAVLAGLAVSLAVVLVARAVLVHTAADRRAATYAGAAHTMATTTTNDPALRDDDTERGRQWARARHLADPAKCPHDVLAFRLGCVQAARMASHDH